MSITDQHCKESLCLAHIHALAGMAGTNLSINQVFDYGVDGQFDPVILRGTRRVVSGFPLQFQAKATTRWELKDGEIIYDLESKTYNDMVTRVEEETSLVLILLCLPREAHHWHLATADATVLKTCCFWYLGSGTPVPNETSTKRVKIPTDQLLTPSVLCELMNAEKSRRLGGGL